MRDRGAIVPGFAIMTATRIIGFGLVDGEPVFMDARTDTYFALESAEKKELIAMLGGGARVACDPRLAEALGFGGEPAEIVRAECPAPARSLVDEPAPAHWPGPADLFSTARVVIGTRSRLRRSPIEMVLEDVLATSASGTESMACGPLLSALTRGFLSSRRLIPVKGNCLVDSLALLRLLGPTRHAAMLVFGVKLHPFAAHCWVQSDDLVLNDRLDNVAAFSPVRVIRCSDVTP